MDSEGAFTEKIIQVTFEKDLKKKKVDIIT